MKNWMYILFLLTLISCKKEGGSCFQKTGEQDTLHIDIHQVDSLFLNVHLNYELYEAPEPYLEIIGGEYLIPQVEVKQRGKRLELTNTNTCRFARGYKDKIKVKIYLPNLSYIFAEVSDTLVAPAALNYADLFILSHTGAGHINLNLNTNNFFMDASSGNMDFVLKGNTNNLGLSIKSSAYGSAKELQVANYVDIYSKSVGDFSVNVEGASGKVNLEGKGDVLLYGQDNGLEETITGEGEILHYF